MPTVGGVVSRVSSFLAVVVVVAACLGLAAASGGASVAGGTSFVVTTEADSGPGSLRQAMLDANAHSGVDSITFLVPGSNGTPVIHPASALPTITDPVSIDGSVSPLAPPGYAGVTLVGDGTFVGIRDEAGKSTFAGMAVTEFSTGVQLVGDGSTMRATAYTCDVGIEVYGAKNTIVASVSDSADIGVHLMPGSSVNALHDSAIGAGNNNTGASEINGIGVFVEGSSNNDLGKAAHGNLIGGQVAGLVIKSVPGHPADGNFYRGKVYGLADGTGGPGIEIDGAARTTLFEFNVAGVGGDAVYIHGDGAVANVLRAARIGAIGVGLPGNHADGIHLGSGAVGTVLGGKGTGRFVQVSGSDGWGINIDGAAGTTMTGGLVGLDQNEVVHANVLGGIRIDGPGTVIGGGKAALGNTISGNGSTGILLTSNATGAVIQGNRVGVFASGAAAANDGDGIAVSGGSGSLIGGKGAAGNVISHNHGTGITVAAATGTTVVGNTIGGNDDLAIDLGADGVDTNDTLDADSGANGHQNYPVITSASRKGLSATVSGHLDAAPGTTYRLDIYGNVDCDASGHGEAEQLMATRNITTDETGHVDFSVKAAIKNPTRATITATATDPVGNTSELSACATAA